MAKERHDQEPKSSTATMAVLVGGIVLVAGLIVWAMTRTVEPDAPPASTAGFSTTAGNPTPVTAATDTSFAAPTPGAITTAATPTPTAPPPQPAGDRAAVTRIAAEDLKAKLDRGEVTVIDVRDGAAYAQEHIPGALNMPFASVEAQIASLPKGKPIVTYCT